MAWQTFLKYYVLGFSGLVGLAMFLGVVGEVRQASRQSDRPLVLPALAQSHPEWFVRDVKSPEEAKRRGLFWVRDSHEGIGLHEVALDLRASTELFNSVFPGYSSLRNDERIFAKYFQDLFQSYIWSPRLRSKDGVLRVASPNLACMDVFGAYGGDVIVFGTSETSASIVPAELSRELATGGESPSVLMCAGPGVVNENVWRAARRMSASGKRAKTVVWGFSYWSTYAGSEAYGKWFAANAHYWTGERPKTHKEPWSTRLVSALKKVRLPSKWPPPFGYIERESIRSNSTSVQCADSLWKAKEWLNGFPISTTLVNDEARLAEEIQRVPTSYDFLEGFSHGDCEIGAAMEHVDTTINEFLKMAERVVIYLPPTTPLQRRASAPCHYQSVAAAIKARAGKRVLVLDHDMKWYGLSYKHFMYPLADKKCALLDRSHLYYEGALRVTRKLAEEIREWRP